MTSEFLQFTVIIDMVLKRAKCDLNGVIKLLFLPQNCKNHPAVEGSAPSVTRLSCNGLFSTEPKLDNFCAKNIYFWFKPFSLSNTLFAFLVAFTPADRFFKRLYGPHAKQANKRCPVYVCLFSKMNTK